MSWESALAVRDEAKQIAKEEREKPAVECPVDGTPLVAARGVLHCSFCGYVTRGKREV